MTSKFDGLECICDTCAGDGSVCYMVGAFYAEPGADFSKVCNRYRRRAVTNYEKLFGTPERATDTMRDMCHNATACACCPLLAQDVEFCKTDSIESLFVWLESEARDD